MRLKPIMQTIVTAGSLIAAMVGLYQAARQCKRKLMRYYRS